MGIKIGRAAGSSVGGLEVAMLSCGYIGANAKKVLKGIKYDGLMRMVGRLEDKDRPLFRKILLAPFALMATKGPLSTAFHEALRTFLSWDLAKDFGLIEQPLIGIADQRSWGFITGADSVSGFRDTMALFKNTPERWPEYFRKIPIYFGGHDGWYRSINCGPLVKISDTVTPLADLVYGTFNNQALKRIEFELKVGRTRTLKIKGYDPGVVNNHANWAFCPETWSYPWDQIACYEQPTKTTAKNFSDAAYLMNPTRAGKYHYLPPTSSELAFFGFTDENLDRSYDRSRPATNIFRGRKKINIAMRGGAYTGKDAYVPFEFELEKLLGL